MGNQGKPRWLVAVAVAVFAVFKEQRATTLFPVRLFIAHIPNSKRISWVAPGNICEMAPKSCACSALLAPVCRLKNLFTLRPDDYRL